MFRSRQPLKKNEQFLLGQVGTMMDPDSVGVQDGEKAFSLDYNPSEAVMKQSTVKVQFFKDGGFDNQPNKTVELVPRIQSSFFFIRGSALTATAKRASVGACTPFRTFGKQDQPSTKECTANLEKNEYKIIEERSKKISYGRDGETGFGGQMTIRNGKYSKTFTFKYPFHLLWMGDINGDGKADIVTSELDEWGKEQISLYISEDPDRRALDELNLKLVDTLGEISGC